MPNKLTTAEWTAKAKATHGNRYDYSKATYVNAKTKIIICCLVPGHGEWLASPDGHLRAEAALYVAGQTGRLLVNLLRMLGLFMVIHMNMKIAVMLIHIRM